MDIIGLLFFLSLPQISIGVAIIGLSIWLSPRLFMPYPSGSLIIMMLHWQFFYYVAIRSNELDGGLGCFFPLLGLSIPSAWLVYKGSFDLKEKKAEGQWWVGGSIIVMIITLILLSFLEISQDYV